MQKYCIRGICYVLASSLLFLQPALGEHQCDSAVRVIRGELNRVVGKKNALVGQLESCDPSSLPVDSLRRIEATLHDFDSLIFLAKSRLSATLQDCAEYFARIKPAKELHERKLAMRR